LAAIRGRRHGRGDCACSASSAEGDATENHQQNPGAGHGPFRVNVCRRCGVDADAVRCGADSAILNTATTVLVLRCVVIVQQTHQVLPQVASKANLGRNDRVAARRCTMARVGPLPEFWGWSDSLSVAVSQSAVNATTSCSLDRTLPNRGAFVLTAPPSVHGLSPAQPSRVGSSHGWWTLATAAASSVSGVSSTTRVSDDDVTSTASPSADCRRPGHRERGHAQHRASNATAAVPRRVDVQRHEGPATATNPLAAPSRVGSSASFVFASTSSTASGRYIPPRGRPVQTVSQRQ